MSMHAIYIYILSNNALQLQCYSFSRHFTLITFILLIFLFICLYEYHCEGLVHVCVRREEGDIRSLRVKVTGPYRMAGFLGGCWYLNNSPHDYLVQALCHTLVSPASIFSFINYVNIIIQGKMSFSMRFS